jgi:hypothetical protein
MGKQLEQMTEVRCDDMTSCALIECEGFWENFRLGSGGCWCKIRKAKAKCYRDKAIASEKVGLFVGE